jgi:hypothetical protein
MRLFEVEGLMFVRDFRLECLELSALGAREKSFSSQQWFIQASRVTQKYRTAECHKMQTRSRSSASSPRHWKDKKVYEIYFRVLGNARGISPSFLNPNQTP